MMENTRVDKGVSGQWSTVVRAYCKLMDAPIPYLPPAEGICNTGFFACHMSISIRS
jgi:hypothetical protein